MPLVGDDPDTRAVVPNLIEKIGFAPLDLGSLRATKTEPPPIVLTFSA
jgi:predicted dinucleotide-binding enzyme